MTISITKSEVAKLLNPSHDSSEVEGLTKLAETLVDKTNTEVGSVSSTLSGVSAKVDELELYSNSRQVRYTDNATLAAYSHTAILAKPTAGTFNLPATPVTGGYKIKIMNETAQAHTVTGGNIYCTALTPNTGIDIGCVAEEGLIGEFENFGTDWYFATFDPANTLS